jgi:hypothetical protein
MTAPDCVAFRAVAPELALGIAVGDERAAALDHLAGCPSCRRELDGFTRTVDSVLLHAPVAEPPSGFETQVLAGLHQAMREESHPALVPVGTGPTVAPSAGGRREGLGGRRSRRWLAVVAVAAVLAGALVGVANWWGDGGAPAPDTVAEGAPHPSVGLLATPEGAVVGQVSVHAGSGPDAPRGGTELVVTLDAGTPPGTYRVQCDYDSGPPYVVGEIEVGAAGVAHWSTTVSVPAYDLRRVRLVSTTGTPNLESEITT